MWVIDSDRDRGYLDEVSRQEIQSLRGMLAQLKRHASSMRETGGIGIALIQSLLTTIIIPRSRIAPVAGELAAASPERERAAPVGDGSSGEREAFAARR